MNQPPPLLPSLQRNPTNKISGVRNALTLLAHRHSSMCVFLPKIRFQPRIQASAYPNPYPSLEDIPESTFSV